MTLEQLRKAYETRPFEPFDLYIADGRRIPVPHQEFIYIPPGTGRTFIVSDSNGITETVDLLLVTSIRRMNGRAKRSAGRSIGK